MANFSFNSKKIEFLVSVSKNAGRAIMDIYKTDFDIEIKDDNSPLTKADTASNEIIHQALKQIAPSIPILSEESSEISYSTRSKWNQYWLVDPLDGTKEFIEGVPHFSVSIGLVENGEPVIGVIYNPATEEMFSCEKGKGVYMNGEKVSVSNKKNLINSTIVVSRSELKRGNSIFCKKYEKDNKNLKKKIIEIEHKLKNNLPTIPSTIEEELACNIFLRAKNLKDFSKLRDLKDNF
mgnify:CR=1 FL=1